MSGPKKVVIVGGGFGGLAAAKALAGRSVDVALVDRTNHHLFQPLLYQVATAALSPADIASATRSLFARQSNITVLMDDVIGVDVDQQRIETAQAGALAYDYLILATGADYSFFGNAAWARHAPVVKTLDDAIGIRERLLAAFEQAERSFDAREIARLMTVIVVGGGPTGVEMAGSIAELGRVTLAGDYRRIDPAAMRILLVEAGQSVLSAFNPAQSDYADRALRRLGVELLLGRPVEDIDEHGIMLDGQRIESANVIWCAGTKAREVSSWLGSETARNGAVIVSDNCSISEHPEVFVIGDAASYPLPGGGVLPGLAPVAKQQGRYVAATILKAIAGDKQPTPFRYRDWGTMAVIGRSRAVADFGWLRLNGFAAWLAWSLVHLMLLIDFRSRVSVYLIWTWAWFTRGRAARLLTRTNAHEGARQAARKRRSFRKQASAANHALTGDPD